MCSFEAQLKLSLFLAFLAMVETSQYDCSKTEYDRCVRIADPLVKEAHLIFPDNLDDIDLVCRTWNQFVDCLKTYTDRCFTEQQRRQFNKAVENPIESVHQMCMQPVYQKEYLQHAPCIKSTITERSHCGPQYSLLVDQVAQGQISSKATLCCSHDRFKQCVLKETKRLCDRGVPDGPASRFSSQIIDKALSFLQDQCFNYIPNSGDCVSITTDSVPFTDPLMISTSPSEIYPWSTVQDPAIVKEIVPSRTIPHRVSTSSWLPSSSISIDYNTQPEPSSAHTLGSRTRPGSYGRSSWSDVTTANTQPGINTVQIYSDSSPSTPASRPDWATVSSWHVGNEPKKESLGGLGKSPDVAPIQRNFPSQSTSTETWYPAAGNQLANEVDEPNQQGLSKPENGAEKNGSNLLSLAVIAVLAAMC